MGKAIGIDLGTTNTVVTYENKRGRLVQLKYKGQAIIPSILYFRTEDDYVIGEEAKKLSEFNRNNAAVCNFKSKLDEKKYKYEIVAENGDKLKLSPKKVVELFLQKIITGVEEKLYREFGTEEGSIERVVITVPAKFKDVQIGKIKKAARDVGLDENNVKTASEPAAAAIACHEDEGESEEKNTILVYDFGGGTFDISVIQKEKDVFKEVESNGDPQLGGNNLTEAVVECFLDKLAEENGCYLPLDPDEFDADMGLSENDYNADMMAIRSAANQAKEELSSENEIFVSIPLILPDDPNYQWEFTFTAKELRTIISSYIKKSVDLTVSTIESATKKGVTIDQIVLAGGTSNIPLVKEKLAERISEIDISGQEDLSTLISRGATILARNIEDIDRMVEPRTNSQLGVAVMEGLTYNKFQMIIPQDVRLPYTRKRTFALSQDNQQRLEIAYYDYDVKNYPKSKRTDEDGITEIDKLIVENLPKGLKKDETGVEVEFTVNTDRSLAVNAKVVDKAGNVITSEDMTWVKESQLE